MKFKNHCSHIFIERMAKKIKSLAWRPISYSVTLGTLSIIGIFLLAIGANMLLLHATIFGPLGVGPGLRDLAFLLLGIGGGLWAVFVYALVTMLKR